MWRGMSASSELLATITIITTKTILNQLQIHGIRLDVAAMLLLGVGVAHFGVTLSPALGLFGLLLFLYTVGVRSGPALRNMDRRDFQLAAVGFGIILVAMGGVVSLGRLLGVPLLVSLGSYAGFFGSGAALALLEGAAGGGGASAAFAVSAPIGAVFIMVLVQIWLALSQKRITGELDEWNRTMAAEQEHSESATLLVEQDEVLGQSLRDLRLGCQVLWVTRDKTSIAASADTVLMKNDVIHVSGSREGVENTIKRVGRGIPPLPASSAQIVVRKFFVSNPRAIEKRLEDLLLRERYGATVTRIRRAGINLRAHHGFRFRWGDRIQVSVPADRIDDLRQLFGDDAHGLETFAFPRAALVIFVGGLLGALPIQLGAAGSLRLGPALGVLVVSLITSALHRTGPMVWSQSGPTTRLMSQIGLPLFLAQIGNESYTGLVQSWDEYGSILFVLAVAPILFVALLVVLAGRLFRYGPLTVLSLLPTVAMNTPALINLQDKFREKIPSHVYATVYPVVALGLLLVMFGLSFWV